MKFYCAVCVIDSLIISINTDFDTIGATTLATIQKFILKSRKEQPFLLYLRIII